LTSFVTFNGNDKIFTIDNVTVWPGLVSVKDNIGNITIQKINLNSINNTAHAFLAGYVISYSSFYNCIGKNIIEYCISNGIITQEFSGGIFGANVFYQIRSSENIIRYCINTGQVNCLSGGGISGSDLFARSLTTTFNINNIFTDCINTGNIISGHGMVGINSFSNSPTLVNIRNCVNTGTINNINQSFGIGKLLSNCIITNCYTLYGILTNSTDNVTITNCYQPSGNWSTNTARNILVNNYPGIWSYYKDPNTGITNKNVPFVLSSLNPTNYVVPTITAFTSNIPLFKEGTKILCYLNTNNEYIFVEDLRNSINNGNSDRIALIGKIGIVNSMTYNYDLEDQLIRCSQINYPITFENLTMTGFDNIQINIAYYMFF
jgi:hypothetical protein